jgi:hypothetical protein
MTEGDLYKKVTHARRLTTEAIEAAKYLKNQSEQVEKTIKSLQENGFEFSQEDAQSAIAQEGIRYKNMFKTGGYAAIFGNPQQASQNIAKTLGSLDRYNISKGADKIVKNMGGKQVSYTAPNGMKYTADMTTFFNLEKDKKNNSVVVKPDYDSIDNFLSYGAGVHSEMYNEYKERLFKSGLSRDAAKVQAANAFYVNAAKNKYETDLSEKGQKVAKKEDTTETASYYDDNRTKITINVGIAEPDKTVPDIPQNPFYPKNLYGEPKKEPTRYIEQQIDVEVKGLKSYLMTNKEPIKLPAGISFFVLNSDGLNGIIYKNYDNTYSSKRTFNLPKGAVLEYIENMPFAIRDVEFTFNGQNLRIKANTPISDEMMDAIIYSGHGDKVTRVSGTKITPSFMQEKPDTQTRVSFLQTNDGANINFINPETSAGSIFIPYESVKWLKEYVVEGKLSDKVKQQLEKGQQSTSAFQNKIVK